MQVPDMAEPHPSELPPLVSEAYARLRRRLQSGAPTLAPSVLEWTQTLSGRSSPEGYFTHPEAFPMLLVPWWLEEVIRGTPDIRFQADLVYSTMCGYYFVRMIDNLMDGESPPEAQLLPALTVLHTEFIQTYHGHFPFGDPFWEVLSEASLASAEMASRDASMGSVTRTEFVDTSARKTVGVHIPVAAVIHRYRRTELLEPWFSFLDRFGRWHQMLNDIVGWRVDLQHGRRTYFLRNAPSDNYAAVGEWVLSEGFRSGFAELDAWMDEAIVAASALGSSPLLTYLASRRHRVEATRNELMRKLEYLDGLFSNLGPEH
jgi:hypothetical protein